MEIKIDLVALGAEVMRFNSNDYPLTTKALELVELRQKEILSIKETFTKEVEEAVKKAKMSLEACNKKFEAAFSLET